MGIAVSSTHNNTPSTPVAWFDEVKVRSYYPRTLYVTNSPVGAGVVNGSGIYCGNGQTTCQLVFSAGAPVTLTPSANDGFDFDYWGVNGQCVGSQGTYSFFMTEDQNVTAHYARIPLNVSIEPSGGGTVTSGEDPSYINCPTFCGYTYDFQDQVVLTAHPALGYRLDHWVINANDPPNSWESTDNPFTFPAVDVQHVDAVFVLHEATDFVFPVLADGVTDPLQNKTNPVGNGWTGYGIGDSPDPQQDLIGHLGQDYYQTGDVNSAGQAVYAVANGTIVEVLNGPGQYGWCNESDHGWGPVVVIRHYNHSGFNTTGSIVQPDTCSTETNPTVIYSLYGHLSKQSIQGLHVGQPVNMGYQIGTIGAYGVDQVSWVKNHLHYELKDQAGYQEGVWYKTGHAGTCPQQTVYNCINGSTTREVLGVGTAYSGLDGFAPNHYDPGMFIQNNQQP